MKFQKTGLQTNIRVKKALASTLESGTRVHGCCRSAPAHKAGEWRETAKHVSICHLLTGDLGELLGHG